MILAAHRLSSIARAERVVVIEEGKVSEEGRYDVLVSLSRAPDTVQYRYPGLTVISQNVKEVASGH